MNIKEVTKKLTNKHGKLDIAIKFLSQKQKHKEPIKIRYHWSTETKSKATPYFPFKFQFFILKKKKLIKLN